MGYATANRAANQHKSDTSNYRKALETIFAPEFVNRLDEIIVFNTLSKNDVEKIVDMELDSFFERCNALGYSVSITSQAKRMLAQAGYNPTYGVRQLKRVIVENVEQQLAQLIVKGSLMKGDSVEIIMREGKVLMQCA